MAALPAASMATSRNAMVARFRPSMRDQSGELGLGLVTTFGRR